MTATEARLGSPVEVPIGDRLVIRGERWGTGDRRALMVHDHGEDLDSIRPLALAFAVAGFETTAIDRIGHGASDDADRPERLVDHLSATIESLGSSAGIYLVGVGEAATACLAIAERVAPSLIGLISPMPSDPDATGPPYVDRSPTFVIYGTLDAAAEAEARRLTEVRPGPSRVVRLPVAAHGSALIAGPYGPQLLNHLVGFARQVAPRYHEGRP